jgi:hypothetical protein
MTMGGENQNKPRVDPQLVMGDYLGLSIGGIVVMIIVWLTLSIPEARQRQTNKYCYYHCLEETGKKMQGTFTSGPRYMSNLKSCYEECIVKENKAKDEKNTSKDDSD